MSDAELLRLINDLLDIADILHGRDERAVRRAVSLLEKALAAGLFNSQ